MNQEVVKWINLNKDRFEKVFLISASPLIFVERIVGPLNIFDEIVGSEDTNLKGKVKLNYIKTVLKNDFCYIGDSRADIPLFIAANEAYLIKKGQLNKIK